MHDLRGREGGWEGGREGGGGGGGREGGRERERAAYQQCRKKETVSSPHEILFQAALPSSCDLDNWWQTDNSHENDRHLFLSLKNK